MDTMFESVPAVGLGTRTSFHPKAFYKTTMARAICKAMDISSQKAVCFGGLSISFSLII
jgi:hypothetical protein